MLSCESRHAAVTNKSRALGFKQSGLTLIELLVAVTVLGFLTSIALPNFRVWIANTKSVANSESLYNSLQYAKTEALRRHGRVSICPSASSGTACGTDWKNGWLVVVDSAATNTDGSVTLASSADILRVLPKLSDEASITLSSGSFVRFTSTGALGATTATTITSSVTGCKGTKARTITVSTAGVIKVTATACQ